MKFRDFIFLILTIFCLFLHSCKEEENPIQILPPVNGGDWEIFQLAKLHVPNIPVDEVSFSGFIGDVAISLGRISGDTLVFIVPNIGEGPTQLKVTMGNQIRTWNLALNYWSNNIDQKTFLEGFLKSNRELQKKIQEVEGLKELSDPFSKWIEFFNEKQARLSEWEKVQLSGAMQQGLNSRFLPGINERYELDCVNGPASTIGSLTYRFIAFDNSYLPIYTSLPQNNFHEAVLAGLGLSIWYKKVLHEYYAYLTLECPQLRGLELKEIESGSLISTQDSLFLESNERVTFGYNGIFKPLTSLDLEDENGEFFLHAIGFRDMGIVSKLFAELIQTFQSAYQWNLPSLNSDALIFPSNDAPISKGPILGFEWFLPDIDNPHIRVVEFVKDQELITLKLESIDSNPQPFKMVIPLNANSVYLEEVFTGILHVSCPVLVDVLLIGKTHFLDIEYGALPLEIVWSNGVTEVPSQNLFPGEYDVKVTDANGCERIVQFTVPEFGTVSDIDGNIYETVRIGEKWWMAENLRTTRMRDGTSIQLIAPDAAWVSATGPAYCWNENDANQDEAFGKLYNYSAACCEICPEGWRLPDLAEMSSLSSIFGYSQGRFLRAVNGWPEGFLKSTNLSGLRFLPSGTRAGWDGKFGSGNGIATFWTGQKDFNGYPFLGFLQGSVDFLSVTLSFSRNDGFSVRCVKE